jgi:hypothetical protein
MLKITSNSGEMALHENLTYYEFHISRESGISIKLINPSIQPEEMLL